MMPDSEVSHGELVHRITDSFQQLSGEEMEEFWNQMFSSMPVKYEGDSVYRWVGDEV